MRKANLVVHEPDGTTHFYIPYTGSTVPPCIVDCIIDTEDYPKVAGYHWNVKPDISSARVVWYVHTGLKCLRIHQIILGAKGGDHRNRDGLDNRKQNLRVATQTENACNRRKRIGNYSSKYKGVSLRPSGSWWVRVSGKHIGCFKSETDAALAYNAAATTKHGEFAVLNQIGG